MPLKLSFPAVSRLWAEVVTPHGEHVFVPTTEAFAVGDAVDVELEAPELLPLTVHGTVQALRPLSGRAPAGVLVKFDEFSLERCRALAAKEGTRVLGRTEPRADCNLPARLVGPVVGEGAVKSLSMGGLTLNVPVELTAGMVCELLVRLSDTQELQLFAAVMWTRPELQLAGLRIGDLSEPSEALLKRTIDGLLGKARHAPRTSATVVVADDDPSILDFLARVITREGHRVVPAERGDQALALVRAEKPAAVFLDVLMPGLDGLDVCKAIRADAALGKTPVVLLSAMGEDRLATAAQEAGANDYLTKPMRLEMVRALLSKYLSKG